MPFEEITILYFQISAAVMMAWDYFTPRSWREYMDGVLGKYFSGVQRNVDKDINQSLEYLKVNIPRIFVSFLAFGLAYLVLKFGASFDGSSRPVAALVTGILYLFLVSGGFFTLMNIIFPLLVPLGIGGVFKAITKFLTSTEKGPLAGLGFLCLLVSFVMRYINYTTT